MIRRNYEYQIPDIKDLELVEGLTARLKDLWGEARENGNVPGCVEIRSAGVLSF